MDKSHHAVLPTHIDVVLAEYVDRRHHSQHLGKCRVLRMSNLTIRSPLFTNCTLRTNGGRAVVQMRPDFEAQKYELLQLRGGHWPSTKNDLAIERMAAQFLGVGIGDSVIFKINDQERTLPVTGLVRHPFVPPPQFMDLAFFFMSGEGMQRLNVPEGKFGSFYVRVTPYSYDHAQEVASAIKDKLAKQGHRRRLICLRGSGRTLGQRLHGWFHARPETAGHDLCRDGRDPGLQHALQSHHPADQSDRNPQGDRRPEPVRSSGFISSMH